MALNTRLGTTGALTTVPVVLTWTANEPTPAATQTIADGDVPTVAELGQWVRNQEAVMSQILVDLTALKALLDDGG